jgi:hypothetical protein
MGSRSDSCQARNFFDVVTVYTQHHMIKFLKVLGIVLLIMSLVFTAGLHMFLHKNGSRLVRSALKHTFHRPVKVGSVKSVFPFGLKIKNIEVNDLFTVRRAIVRGGMLDIFSGNLVFSELQLTEAEINVYKQAICPLPISAAAEESKNSAPAAVPAEAVVANASTIPAEASAGSSSISHYFFVKRLVIIDGTVNFIDPDKGAEGVKVAVTGINGQVRNLQFPAVSSVITSFTLTGGIPWGDKTGEGKIDLNGWINLVDKDMRADLKVTDIDALTFYPYCQEWMPMDKSRIGKARVNFQSQITGLKNDVTMDSHLDLASLQFKERKEGEPEQRAEKVTAAIVNILQANNMGKISLDFKIRTKMDSPEFGFGVIRSAFETKVSEAIRQEANRPGLVKAPARIVGGTFKAAADLTRAVISGTVDIGSAVTSSFKRFFSREQPAPNAANSSADPEETK